MRAAVFTVALMATIAAAPSDPDFSADRFKAHVAFLADDLLEGREAGTRGHEIAAKYIAAEFASFGLKPGGDDGTYFKKVDLLESAIAATAPTLSITTPAGPKALKQGVTAVISGPIGGGSVRVRGPLVFVGYGMTDKAMGYDDYQGLDVRGKIAVVLLGSPKGMDSEIGAHLLHEQPRFAAEHGAVAVLRIPTRLMSTALPWDKVVQYLSDPVTTWVRKDGTPDDPTHGLKAGAMLAPKAAASLFDGAGTTLSEILDEADKEGGRPKGMALK